MSDAITLHQSWKTPLLPEFEAEYMQRLRAFLMAERAKDKRIFPPAKLWFHALDTTPLDTVRVVILGQDPYHGPGQAHGLCFSVRPGVPPPPSLVNIYKELETDLGVPPAPHGCLQAWAEQGVFLLNPTLSVRAGAPGSHSELGWRHLTDAAISALSSRREGIVFLLWGKAAEAKAALVDETVHAVLRAPHPRLGSGSGLGLGLGLRLP